LNNDPQSLDGVLKVLDELRQGWKELELMTKNGEVASGGNSLKSRT